MKSAVLLASIALGLAACSTPGVDPDPPGAGGGGGAGSTSSSGAGTPDASAPFSFKVSLIAEAGAGQAPALFRMFNDTPDQILSLSLADGQAFTFSLVDPLAVTDYVATISADLKAEAYLSLHANNLCLRKEFQSMAGPLSLEPGHAYSIHVTLNDGYQAEIVEDPMPAAYVGVRANITDPTPYGGGLPAQLVLSLATPGGPAEIALDNVYDSLPGPYGRVDADHLELSKVRFVDQSGGVHETAAPLSAQGAFGYTVRIAGEIAEGAAASADLVPASP